jgi:mRNA-degrading endonuclease toxin of MazEF toxin-antitoxin module
MRRGDIWTVPGGKDYAGKPRPVVILQDDRFDATASITVCAFTTDETDAPTWLSDSVSVSLRPDQTRVIASVPGKPAH